MSESVELKLAHVGSLKQDKAITGNICTWIFSNPFARESLVAKQAPVPVRDEHDLDPIHPDTLLTVDDATGASFTWQQVRQSSLSLAAGILSQSLPPSTTPTSSKKPRIGPVVLLCLPNCAQFPIALFGILSARCTATMASIGSTASELATMMRESSAQLLITIPSNKKKAREASEMAGKASIQIYTVAIDGSDLIGTTNTNKPEKDSWRQLMLEPLPQPTKMDYSQATQTAAVILWSSGTSGKPKGIVMTHQALIASLVSLWHVNSTFRAGERWLGVVPFYHIFGLVNILLLAPCCGATIFTLAKFEPSLFLNAIPRHGITCLHMAPPVALLLAKDTALKQQNFITVRNALCGGAPVAWDVVETVYRRLGIQIRMGYGLSEAGSVCNQLVLDDDISDHQGHTGVPLYGVELKICSTDEKGTVLPVGEVGSIFVRSGGMMKGYLNDTSKTAAALDSDSWFDTGDLGFLDSKGRLHITGRMKDTIKVRGFQVSPVELEELILALPSVADVAVAAVYDELRATELPRAYVRPAAPDLQTDISVGQSASARLMNLGQDIRLCVEKASIHYKWLKGNVMFVNAIPKSPAGKILRKDLPSTPGVLCHIYDAKSSKRESKI